MNRALFDWQEIANSIFRTVLISEMVDGTPVLGITQDGDLLFRVAI